MSDPISYRGEQIRIHEYVHGRRNRDLYESYVTVKGGGWTLAQSGFLTENGALLAGKRAIDRMLVDRVEETF